MHKFRWVTCLLQPGRLGNLLVISCVSTKNKLRSQPHCDLAGLETRCENIRKKKFEFDPLVYRHLADVKISLCELWMWKSWFSQRPIFPRLGFESFKTGSSSCICEIAALKDTELFKGLSGFGRPESALVIFCVGERKHSIIDFVPRFAQKVKGKQENICVIFPIKICDVSCLFKSSKWCRC